MGIALAIVVALVCGIALPAMANDETATPTPTTDNAKVNVIKGKVTSIDENKAFFIVQPAEGDAVTINVDSNTRYFKIIGTPAATTDLKQKLQDRLQERKKAALNMEGKAPNRFNNRGLGGKNPNTPTPSAVTGNQVDENEDTIDENANLEDSDVMEECLSANCEQPKGFFDRIKSWFNRNPKYGLNAKFEGIAVGDGIVARVMPNEYLTKQVLIIKPAAIKTVRGEITAITDDSFTVTPYGTDTESVTLRWNEKTVVTLRGDIVLKTGQYAAVVYKVDGLIAQIVTVMPKPPTPTAAPTTTPTE
jgi:hypothetical protein